ncbi:MAG TPA: XRE family transcriptional regulator, partial [Clostridia bacterium]|nr:XRE family transcriptional regulator [Clostridia bacterium]
MKADFMKEDGYLNPEIIKLKRLEKGYTLAYMSEQLGFTASFLSQLERGLKKPSLDSLRKISDFLELPMIYFFFDDETEQKQEPPSGDGACRVIRRGNRQKIMLPEIQTEYEMLTPSPNEINTQLNGSYCEVRPGCYMSEKMITHGCDESMLVLKGKMRAFIGDATYDLEDGDSI